MTERFAIDLTGLQVAPAQTWGSVRMVPLLRAEPLRDLRLHPRLYGPNTLSVVNVSRNQRPQRQSFEALVAFIPHSLVATWTTDGSPVAMAGTQMIAPNAQPSEGFEIVFRRRMARRLAADQVRFLPLDLAIEGYLNLGFSGPPTRWPEWSRAAFRDGLSPQIEQFYCGHSFGLEDALRIFEIHPNQSGVVLYVGEQLAAAFVVPHPEDYRVLHPSLIEHSFGAELWRYAAMYPNVPDLVPALDDDSNPATDLADLRCRLAAATEQWRELHTLMAAGLLDTGLDRQVVYRMGRFTLSRFLPEFDPAVENHIGEVITDDNGQLAYLSTVRLSATQTKRGHLLSVLSAHDWQLDDAAAALKTDRESLILRIDNAGFGHLLKPDLLARARRQN